MRQMSRGRKARTGGAPSGPSGSSSRGTDGLGVVAVWLSSLSALIYFLTSYGIKNHILLLVQTFRKALGFLR
jgi:hypothetical protein